MGMKTNDVASSASSGGVSNKGSGSLSRLTSTLSMALRLGCVLRVRNVCVKPLFFGFALFPVTHFWPVIRFSLS